MIQIDPMATEEVILYRRGKMVGQRTETVCQFERAQDLMSRRFDRDEQPEPLAVAGYNIDATITGSYKFFARTTIKLVGRFVAAAVDPLLSLRRARRRFRLHRERHAADVLPQGSFWRAVGPSGRTARRGQDAGDPGRLPWQPDRFRIRPAPDVR